MKKLYVALENVRSLYNIGALFRTCSFFGVKRVILVGYSGKKRNLRGEVVLHEEIKKTALGSEKTLEITMLESSEDLIEFAQKGNLKLVPIEQYKDSTSFKDWTPESDSILVFGNEVDGVSEEVLVAADQIVEIPRLGEHHSLNITTTCGIILSKLVY